MPCSKTAWRCEMNEKDLTLLNEILDDLKWARSMLSGSYDPTGYHLDNSISKLTMRIEELEDEDEVS